MLHGKKICALHCQQNSFKLCQYIQKCTCGSCKWAKQCMLTTQDVWAVVAVDHHHGTKHQQWPATRLGKFLHHHTKVSNWLLQGFILQPGAHPSIKSNLGSKVRGSKLCSQSEKHSVNVLSEGTCKTFQRCWKHNTSSCRKHSIPT